MVTNPELFEAISGHGLRARYADHTILIGNRKLMQDNNIVLNIDVNTTLVTSDYPKKRFFALN